MVFVFCLLLIIIGNPSFRLMIFLFYPHLQELESLRMLWSPRYPLSHTIHKFLFIQIPFCVSRSRCLLLLMRWKIFNEELLTFSQPCLLLLMGKLFFSVSLNRVTRFLWNDKTLYILKKM